MNDDDWQVLYGRNVWDATTGYTIDATNFHKQKQCLALLLAFRNNFEEITNTSSFLRKQLDFSLSISIHLIEISSS